MGFGDPLLEELYGVIREDLEEVVKKEIENIRMLLGCVDANVYDNEELLEFHTFGGLVAGLPSIHVFFEHKIMVYEAVLTIEVLRDSMSHNIARIMLWFIKQKEPTCYMHVDIFTHRINELAEAIIYDMKVWGEQSGEA
jgi:hypothetical protein